MSISTVCFTGHRPSDLGTTPAVAKSALRKAIAEAIKRGATTFIAGGAIGVDTYASQLVIEAKASNPSIKLYIAVPFRGFTKYWSNAQRVEYADIIRKCDGFKVICDKPSKHAYHVRNSFMVDRADLVIAYWSGKRNGGTYATVQYAQQTHTPVVNCYPKAESCDHIDLEHHVYHPAKEPASVYVVQLVAGSVKHDFTVFETENEATKFCEKQHWIHLDSNQFEWNLEIAERPASEYQTPASH